MKKYVNFKEISPNLHRYFSKKEEVRNSALSLSRTAIRSCGLAIKNVHRSQRKEAQEYLDKAEKDIREIKKILKNYPDLWQAGFVQDAQKEFVEAKTIYSISYHNIIPDPESLKVEYAAYLNGLSEAIGELRRMILDLIRKERTEKGINYLNLMEEIYYFLMEFDYPDTLTSGLRRNVDLVRSLLEKTRGELTTSINFKKLKKSIKILPKF